LEEIISENFNISEKKYVISVVELAKVLTRYFTLCLCFVPSARKSPKSKKFGFDSWNQIRKQNQGFLVFLRTRIETRRAWVMGFLKEKNNQIYLLKKNF
jgi:hypothetical protein